MSQPKLNSDSTFLQAAHVEQSFCHGGVALWDTQQDAYYHLNDTGAEIWQHLQQPSSVSSLVRKLGRDFDAPPATLRSSVETLVRKLIDNDLVRRSNRRAA